MAITYPPLPWTAGDTFTGPNGATYTYDAVAGVWTAAGGGGGGATATVPASLDIVSFYPPSRRSPNGIMYVVGTTSGGVDNLYAGSSPADLTFVAAAAAGVGNYVDLVEAPNGIVWGG